MVQTTFHELKDGLELQHVPGLPVRRRVVHPAVSYTHLMALRGGADGLDFYRRIAAGVGEHLLPGGVLFLEVGYDQASEVADMLGREGLKTECHQDYQGILRMVEAWRK